MLMAASSWLATLTSTCSTSGWAGRAPDRTDCSSAVRTNTFPVLGGDVPVNMGSAASIAATAKLRDGAPLGHTEAAGAGTCSRPGRVRRPPPSPAPNTRSSPHEPSCSLKDRPL